MVVKNGTICLFVQHSLHQKVAGIASNVDPDLTAPLEEQSDLGLHCLFRLLFSTLSFIVNPVA